MGSRNTKLKRGCRDDTPQGKSSFDGFLNQCRGYFRHMLEGLSPEEIVELLAEVIEEQDQEYRIQRENRPNLEDQLNDLEEKVERLQRAEKQF